MIPGVAGHFPPYVYHKVQLPEKEFARIGNVTTNHIFSV